MGYNNTAIGQQALLNNTTGFNNTASGYRALRNNTTGDGNTSLGSETLRSNTTGISNTASGKNALYNNTTGYNNSAHGSNAMYSNTIGFENTANGRDALKLNTSGNYNTAIGSVSLSENTTGSRNTASGRSALAKNTIGVNNSANGYTAMAINTTGSNNSATGYRALYDNTTGSDSSATGHRTLDNNTTGSNNSAMGNRALYSNTTGFRNTALGAYAFTEGAIYSNSMGLGYDAEPGASNTVRVGNSSVSTIGGYALWTMVSDGRFKVNVTENVIGLDFIRHLRPVTYNLDMDAIARFNNTHDSMRSLESEHMKAGELQSGFIAQEVETAALSVGYDFHGVDKPRNETSYYGLRYAEFVVPLVKAVQELAAVNETQSRLIEELRLEQAQLLAEFRILLSLNGRIQNSQ